MAIRVGDNETKLRDTLEDQQGKCAVPVAASGVEEFLNHNGPRVVLRSYRARRGMTYV
jgi:hypothetical protein